MDKPPAKLPSVISFQRNICRTCLRKISTSDSVEIFSDKHFYKGRTLSHIFEEITYTLVNPTEMLPTNICLKCAERVKHTVAFKRSIDKADQILRCKLRLAGMKVYLKKVGSVTSVLDALCNELVEIPNEFENGEENQPVGEPVGFSMETALPSIKRKPVDIDKLRTWQANLDNIVARKPLIIARSNRSLAKITNKTVNQRKTVPELIIIEDDDSDKPTNNNNKSTNINQPSSNPNKSQNSENPQVTIFRGKQFTEKVLNKVAASDRSLDQPVEIPEISKVCSRKTETVETCKENNPQKNDAAIINDIIHSGIGNTVIVVEDAGNSGGIAREDCCVKEEPMVVEVVNEEEIINAQNSSENLEKKNRNPGKEDGSQEKENRSPEKKSNIQSDSNIDMPEGDLKKDICGNDKDGPNSHKELSWDKSNSLVLNLQTTTTDSEIQFACYICDKKFTKLHFLQRHLLYHSLKLEPNDQAEKENANRNTRMKTLNILAVYEKAKWISDSLKRTTGTPQDKPIINLTDNPNQRPLVLTHRQREEELRKIHSINRAGFKRTFTDPKIKQIMEMETNDHNYNCPVSVPQKLAQQPTGWAVAECKYCKQEVKEVELRIHILREHRELYLHERRARYKCSVCLKGYRTTNLMLAHMKTQHEPKYKCDHCDKTFTQRKALYRHLFKSHGIRRTSLCYICGKIIRSSLWVHIKTHTTMKTVKCTVEGCTAVLKYNHSLQNHMKRVHETEKSFICERCGKSFALKDGLMQHMRIHMEVLPHACDICGKGFLMRSRLKRHMLAHQHNKPYSCPICPQVFAQKQSIIKHCERYHPEHPLAQNKPHYLGRYASVVQCTEKPFECMLCQRKFAHECNLKKHHRTFHPLLYYSLKRTQ